ncbi:MAG: RNA-binding cell elongation regulator Jag/EloR [Lachnospirales bacterium]
MEKKEFESKNVDCAVNEALSYFKASSKEDLVIEILDEGAKGLFGFGSRNAKITVSKKFDPVAEVKELLEEFSEKANLKYTIDIDFDGKDLNISLNEGDAHVLIGKHGVTMESFQYLLNLMLNTGKNPYVNIFLDVENYRDKRKETLEKLANNLAKKVMKTKRPYRLEPMNPYERRVIHVALQNNSDIRTTSEGREPYRSVVINLA